MSVGTLQRVEDAPQIVQLTGALTGSYEVQDTQEDGTVILRPDTSYAAVLRRAGGRPRDARGVRARVRGPSHRAGLSTCVMPSTPSRLWRVRIDPTAWQNDLRAASPTARTHAHAWRERIEASGGLVQEDLRATRAEDDLGIDLPNCVKTRIPDPEAGDPAISPWGAVLGVAVDATGLHLQFLAFGLRHPDRAGRQPSVYQRAHRRLS